MLMLMESVRRTFFNGPRVHFMRNVLAHSGKSGRRVVSAFIATAFAQETPEAASFQWLGLAPHHGVAARVVFVPASHSPSFVQRRQPETFFTAMATAFACPTITTSFLPRVMPV